MRVSKMNIPVETWQEWERVTAQLRACFQELDQKKTRTRHVVDNTTRTSSGMTKGSCDQPSTSRVATISALPSGEP